MMFGSNTVTAFAAGNGSTDEQFGAEEKYTLDLLGIIIIILINYINYHIN